MAYFDEVKVGDRVWSFVIGWAVVDTVEDDLFRVRYDIKGYDYYTYDGVILCSKSNQTLFWDEVKFEVPQRPKIELKETDFAIDTYNDRVVGIDNATITKEKQNMGLYRKDSLTAEKALNQIKRFMRLLALRDQECESSRGYEFTPLRYNYSLAKNTRTGEYYHRTEKGYIKSSQTVYFKTFEDCKKICDILNSGRFDLDE